MLKNKIEIINDLDNLSFDAFNILIKAAQKFSYFQLIEFFYLQNPKFFNCQKKYINKKYKLAITV